MNTTDQTASAEFVTIVVDANLKPLKGASPLRYRAPSARTAAQLAARAQMTSNEWRHAVPNTDADDGEGSGRWTFIPRTGSPVRIVVRPAVDGND